MLESCLEQVIEIQVNEDSKLKSEVYEVRRLYVQKEGKR